MKTFFKNSLALMLTLIVSVMGYAQTEIDGIHYILNSETKEAEVSSCNDTPGKITIPSAVKYSGITYKVTSIGKKAFSTTNFYSVIIPNSVKSIGEEAFACCYNLESITIPNSVTSIEERAFRDCPDLTSVTISNSVKRIENGTFRNCPNLTSVTIPNSVTSIGESSFCDCESLESITFPKSSLTTIGMGAFESCSRLTSIIIPKSVTFIGYATFKDCPNLTSIIVETGNKVYDSRNDCNAIIKTATNELLIGCQNTFIPNTVTSIGNWAFSPGAPMQNYFALLDDDVNNKITSIVIPNSVTHIGDGAFAYCTGLTSITFSNSLTSIGDVAFWDCSSLNSITIPASVTSIGESAFYDCSKLVSVTNLSKTPQDITPKNIQEGITNETFSVYGTLHVLPGCKAAYEAAEYWNKFTIIEDALLDPKDVTDLIANIGTVEYTEACKAKIDAARSAYDALTKEQQTLVKNVNILIDAEKAYEQFKTTNIADINIQKQNEKKAEKHLVNGKIVIIKDKKNYNVNGQSI